MNLFNIENIAMSHFILNKTEFINLDNNPIRCDCGLYDLLRYNDRAMTESVRNTIHISTRELICASPFENRGLKIHSFKYDTYSCKMKNFNFHQDEPCGTNGNCDCFFRPFDKALLINCSSRNMDSLPIFLSEFQNVDRVELYLQSNNLKDIPNMNSQGYNKIQFLDLSDNQISEVTESILSNQLTVSS